MPDRTSDDLAAANTGVGAMRTALDGGALADWMRGHVDGFSGPLEIGQFNGGQSNPTYRLTPPDAR
jgi:aminoglycoside phosphotransferase (APT) family kinase protein